MTHKKTLLEICTATIDDALIAEAAGADRIEINSALPLGGLTPSPGCVKAIDRRISIPVIAMVRPRESGFCYSDNEFHTMLGDIQWLLESGVAGIAFGILNHQGHIDTKRCMEVVKLVGHERTTVFHRAFDVIPNQGEALEVLVDCGVSRIMTSGGHSTAWQGRRQIRNLVNRAAGRIEVLAAGGIRIDHVCRLVSETSVDQVHAGLGEPQIDRSWSESTSVSFYSQLPENPAQFSRSSHQSIREMRETLDGSGSGDS